MKIDIYETWTDAEGLKMSLRVSIPRELLQRSGAIHIGNMFYEKLSEALLVGIRRLKK